MAEYFAEDAQTEVVLVAPVGPILRTLISPKLLTHIPAASVEAKDEFHIIMEYKRDEKVSRVCCDGHRVCLHCSLSLSESVERADGTAGEPIHLLARQVCTIPRNLPSIAADRPI